VFDELKTHLRQGRRVLRSKTAELVRQEFYGWVLAHYAVRWLLHEGAARCGQADEALSFTAHVQLMRRELPRSGAFPPQRNPDADSDGFVSYCRPAPRPSACERSTSSGHAWSSAAIRRTPPTRHKEFTARAALSPASARPRGDEPRQPGQGQQRTSSCPNGTVLG
jgi:hypothetical protein